MRHLSVFFVLFVSLFTSFSVYAKNDATTVCNFILGTEVAWYRESASVRTGNPLVDNKEQPVSGPYSRMYYREDVTSGQKIKLAVISPEDYSEDLEQQLKAMGYLGMTIRFPDGAAIDDPKYMATLEDPRFKDFMYVMEWVRTVIPNPRSIENFVNLIAEQNGGLNSAKGKEAKARLEARLAKSKSYTPEIAPLDWADYKEWYEERFAKDILSRNGGIPVYNPPEKQAQLERVAIDMSKPLKGQMVENDDVVWKRIFFRNSKGELVGGSLLSFAKKDTYKIGRVRAASWSEEAHEHELATRAFAESINVGTQMGMDYVSYGEDIGASGIDGKLGLTQFKAQIGMSIVPSMMYKQTALIKYFPENIRLLRDNSIKVVKGVEKPVVPPNEFGGIVTYGVLGNDPNRMEKIRLIKDALTEDLSYEQRIEMTTRAVSIIQVGAEWDAKPMKAYVNLKDRVQIARQEPPASTAKEEKPQVSKVPTDSVIAVTDNASTIGRKMMGENKVPQVARSLSRLNIYLQKLPGAQNRPDKTNERFVELMMGLQAKGITGEAILALSKVDNKDSEPDLLAGIEEALK